MGDTENHPESFVFLTWEELVALQEAQLRLHGGQQGFSDQGVVRSVLNRAQFTAQYNPEADLADLAADYMFGLSTTQGFLDGNKRAALAAASTFLRMNGYQFIITEKLMYLVAIAVARGELDRDGLAEILRTHIEPREEEPS
ncbi:MAG TPA: type II toxin-antitoxin system death-on-curing family toxin [Phycisphaerae bacterium]|jgi:death-on-curing protein|nr:type II toxin-antitoxin system death-on-curing family toxin [Phycisphaerae bacterium]